MSKNPTIPPLAETPNDSPTAIAGHLTHALNDRPQIDAQDLAAGYAAMTADEVRETEATAWAEALITDVADEPTHPN
jgi:hypothetical protein